MPERLGLFVAAVLVAATPAAAQLKPSTPQSAAAATIDCWQAVGPGKVDEAMLRARGWRAGSMAVDKKPVTGPLKVYGKAGSNVVLLVVASGAKPNCAILAGMNSAADVSQTADVLLARLRALDPTLKAGRQGKGVVFASGGRAALLEGAGPPDKLVARIFVGYGVSEKK